MPRAAETFPQAPPLHSSLAVAFPDPTLGSPFPGRFMPDKPRTYSLPSRRFTRWLAEPGHDVPDDVRVALIGNLYGTLPIFLGGVGNSIAVASLITVRNPKPWFLTWCAFEIAVCLTRLVVLLAAQRAAERGRPTPTDLSLVLALVWAGSLGFGGFISLTSGDWVAATLSCLSAAAMMGGTCFRNFAAPRLTGGMIAMTLGPIALGAAMSGEPILLVTFVQIPIYLATMAAAAYRLNGMMIATMRAERENGFRALHDGLTGLVNRAGLTAAMERALRAPGEEMTPVGLLYLDLDDFKAVNDGHGHAVGDRLLQMVADRVRDEIGPRDTAARIGGDEFVVLCPERTRGELVALSERLIARLSEPYAFDHERAIIGASVGLALSAVHGRDPAGLLHAADQALYRSKSLGKARCTIAPRPAREGGCAEEGRFGRLSA